MLLDCLCCTRLIRTSIYCLFRELPSASTRFRSASTAAHPLEFEVSRCKHPNLKNISWRPKFMCGMAFSTQCLTPKRSMGLGEQSIFGCFPQLCFSPCSVTQVLVMLRIKCINHFIFPLGPVPLVLTIIIHNNNYYYYNNNALYIVARPSKPHYKKHWSSTYLWYILLNYMQNLKLIDFLSLFSIFRTNWRVSGTKKKY